MGMPFPLIVMYPSGSPELPEKLGPFVQEMALDGPVEDGVFPLVVVSHGNGGSHLVYRTLASHLARNGFIVAMPEHPLNNRNNNALSGTAANLKNRPRHIRLVIDRLTGDSAFAPSLRPDAVAIVGHSLGGYTALAIAGGRPSAFAHETPERQPGEIDVTQDNRVKALVLLAPAAAWFMRPGALSDVRVPVLMLTAEKDQYTPEGHAEIIKRGLPGTTPIEHRIVANAGHFSFLSPFPDAIAGPAFAPSQDPPGFDRVRFHAEMSADVLAFLRRVFLTG